MAVKGDFFLKLAYRWCGLGFDIGYNIYGHSSEKIELPCNHALQKSIRRKFALKGTEGTCCFNYPIAEVTAAGETTATVFPDGTSFPPDSAAPTGCPALESPSTVTQAGNNAVQPNATAFHAGTLVNIEPLPTDCAVCLNTTVATPIPVSDLIPANGFYNKAGAQPVPGLLSVNDLDIRSGEAHSLVTHKLFVFMSYTWMDECGWNPSLGIGGEFEFDANHFRSSLERTGASQWGVLVKGNISF